MVVQYQDPDLQIPGERLVQGVTVFIYGSVGSWKTSWAGQWPKPVFLSVGPEGGDDALTQLPDLYGAAVPRVYNVNSTGMMVKKVDTLAQNYVAMDVNTVVIDSITYYVDLWIAELMAGRYNDPKIRAKIEQAGGQATNLTMRDWGLLAMHIRDIAIKLHNTKLNIIWTALEKEIKQNDEQQGTSRVVGVEPYIRGESYIKLPGLCKMIIHANKEMRPDPRIPGRTLAHPVFYTSPNFMTKMVRHKYGNAFPEGRLVTAVEGQEAPSDIPTFRSIWDRIGRFVYYT